MERGEGGGVGHRKTSLRTPMAAANDRASDRIAPIKASEAIIGEASAVPATKALNASSVKASVVSLGIMVVMAVL